MAKCQGFFDPYIFVLALLTTTAFQVTSNFANDYGDGVQGLGGEDRSGPKRAVQGGAWGRTALKRGIVISVIRSLLFPLLLIYTAFGSDQILYLILFFSWGILSS